MKKTEEIFDPEELGTIVDLDESTFLGYNQFKTARDHLPVFKSSKFLPI